MPQLPETNDTQCQCVIKNRETNESMRDWLKRWMCMWHWMETDYYQNKLTEDRQLFTDVDKRLK